MPPKVSIVIPAYNAAEFLGRTIESVLAQDDSSYETIIVDDGSKDATPRVIEPYRDRVRYIRQDNGGPSRARNRGVQESAGKYIALLDADDLWLPDKLKSQVDLMENHPEVGFSFTDCVIVSKDGKPIARQFETKPVLAAIPVACFSNDQRVFQGRVLNELVRQNFIITSSMMIRADCFEKVGMFDESLFSVEDYDFWLRLSREFQGAYLNRILVKKIDHGENISMRNERVMLNRIKLSEKMVEVWRSATDITDASRSFQRRKLQQEYLDAAHWYVHTRQFRKAAEFLSKTFGKGLGLRGVLDYGSTFFTDRLKTLVRKMRRPEA